MARRESTPNGIPGPFSLGYGPNGIVLQTNPPEAPVNEGHITDHGVGREAVPELNDSSREAVRELNDPTPVRFQDLLAADGLLDDPPVIPQIDRNNQGVNIRPDVLLLQQSSDTGLVSGQFTDVPSIVQGDSSGNPPHGIQLNSTDEGNSVEANNPMVLAVSLHPRERLGRPADANQNEPAANESDDSLVISSGIARYVLEENVEGEGPIPDGRRLSCKRRAPEDPSGSSSGSSRSSKQAVNAQEMRGRGLTISTPQQNTDLSNILAAGQQVAMEPSPATLQPSTAQMSGVVGQEHNSETNIQSEGPSNGQDSVPTSLPSATRNPSVLQSLGQAPPYIPLAQQHASSTAGMVNSSQAMQQGQIPNCVITRQAVQLNSIARMFNNVPPTSGYALVGRDFPQQQQQLRNNAGNNNILPEFHGRNLPAPPNPSLNFHSGASFRGNIVSSSLSPPPPFVTPTTAPWFTQPQPYVPVGFPGAVNQANYRPVHMGVPANALEMDLTVRGGNVRASGIQQVPVILTRPERPAGANPEMTFQASIPPALRSRLIAEVRNAIVVARRTGSPRIQDVMVIDRSVVYGVREEPDQHEDMRLDVDNMSYEELIALGERIGSVSTGVSEDVVNEHLERLKYQVSEEGSSSNEVQCCICQEEYVDGEELGKLKCKHEFHFNCIKQWLGHKNNCPICKMKGLDVEETWH